MSIFSIVYTMDEPQVDENQTDKEEDFIGEEEFQDIIKQIGKSSNHMNNLWFVTSDVETSSDIWKQYFDPIKSKLHYFKLFITKLNGRNDYQGFMSSKSWDFIRENLPKN